MRLIAYISIVFSLQLTAVHADIIWTPLAEPIALWTWGPPATASIDIDGDGNAELTLAVEVGFAGVRAEGDTRILVHKPPPPDLPGPVDPIFTGEEIGPGIEIGSRLWFGGYADGPEDPAYDTDFRNFVICVTSGCDTRFELDGVPKYMGVEFRREDDVHYGWLRVFSGGTVAAVSVTEWAWESQPGVPIIAGAIPEPSAALLLLLGGSFLIAFRNKC